MGTEGGLAGCAARGGDLDLLDIDLEEEAAPASLRYRLTTHTPRKILSQLGLRGTMQCILRIRASNAGCAGKR